MVSTISNHIYCRIALFPIAGIKTKKCNEFLPKYVQFHREGRELIHDKLKGINNNILKYIMENPIQGETTEYNDNRVSLYVGQNGKCSITGEPLQISDMESHHELPKKLGGNDGYTNLTFITYDIHKLIHATADEKIQHYTNKLEIN